MFFWRGGQRCGLQRTRGRVPADGIGKRLTGAGLETSTEDNTTCCYAVQDKVWVNGPGQEPWEVYTVKADSGTFGTTGATPATCCTPDAETGEVDKATQPEGCCS